MVAISAAEYVTQTTDIAAPSSGNEILYPFDNGSTSGRQWRVRDSSEVITAILKHNYGASAAPTTGDDVGDGYAIGSIWVDTTNDQIYQCVDNSSAAAVWRGLSQGTTKTLTNTTFDAQGTGNALSNVGASEVIADLISGQSTTGSIDITLAYALVEESGTLYRITVQNLLASSYTAFGTEDLGDIGGTSTTSTTGVDVTNSDFSVTIGIYGEIQCTYHVLALAGNTGTFLELRLVAGAVNGAWHPIVFAATGGVNYVSFTDTLSGVSSGSQTVKLQVRSSSGSSVTIDTAQGFANDVLASWITR